MIDVYNADGEDHDDDFIKMTTMTCYDDDENDYD